MSKGNLIAIEGIDGAGKSSLIKRLATARCIATREPTDGPHGREIRAAFHAGRRLPPAEERALFEADRREHVTWVINPELRRGRDVITDRYFYATAAYQGGNPAEAIAIARSNERFAPRPQLVIYLDLPVDAALARIELRGESRQATEKAETLGRVRAHYEALWAQQSLMTGVRFLRLEATRPIDELVREAKAAIAALPKQAPTLEAIAALLFSARWTFGDDIGYVISDLIRRGALVQHEGKPYLVGVSYGVFTGESRHNDEGRHWPLTAAPAAPQAFCLEDQAAGMGAALDIKALPALPEGTQITRFGRDTGEARRPTANLRVLSAVSGWARSLRPPVARCA